MKYSQTFKLRNDLPLLVRNAVVQDTENVLIFLKNVFSETDFLDLTSDEFSRSKKQQEDIIKFYKASSNSLMLLGIYKNDIAGILTLTGKIGIKMFHRSILGLAVKKRYWGIGIAHSLMEAAIIACANSPIIKLELEVVTTNHRAIALYKKFGFSIDGIIKYAKIYENKLYDHYIMSKLIKEIE